MKKLNHAFAFVKSTSSAIAIWNFALWGFIFVVFSVGREGGWCEEGKACERVCL